MIPINELRIGNWVKRDSQPEGFQIDAHSFIVCERDPNLYQPIPLTEEWLLKFGFRWATQYNWYEHSNPYILLKKDFTLYEKPFGITIKLESVHQLQNLYFALTGQELEL